MPDSRLNSSMLRPKNPLARRLGVTLIVGLVEGLEVEAASAMKMISSNWADATFVQGFTRGSLAKHASLLSVKVRRRRCFLLSCTQHRGTTIRSSVPL